MKQSSKEAKLSFTGERFVPEKEGNIRLEHLHRYLLAAELVSGKKVLDVASGEGFGSEILAATAEHVTGVDIDPESVAHANQRYGNDALHFVVGDAAEIPLEDNSFDVVVSFETIEHHDRHDEMISEIRRVLRPDGVLILSSPEKHMYTDVPGTKNAYHVKELYRDEFAELMAKNFKHVAMYGQRVAWGSLILSETDAVRSRSRHDASAAMHEGVPDPLYLIAVASNAPLTQLPSGGLLEQDVLKGDPVLNYTAKLLDEMAANRIAHERKLALNEAENAYAKSLLVKIRKSKWFKIGKPFHGLRIPRSLQAAMQAQAASGAETNSDGSGVKAINLLFPIGHFYSPIADPVDIAERSERIFARQDGCVGIDFREADQLKLLEKLKPLVEGIDYPQERPEHDETTYFYGNDQFPVLDAEFLYGALQHFRPKKVIEIGCGFSSLVTADVNRRLMNREINFTCVEPYPRQFLIDGVDGISHLEVSKVEDLPLGFFHSLEENDILFIDSSHVSKVGSDVNYLFFEVIPRLKPGVIVHVHDIFLPDEYPENWVIEQNRNWNEQYLLRSFLQFNSEWSVIWASHLMGTRHSSEVQKTFPRYPRLGGGGSLWMQRKTQG